MDFTEIYKLSSRSAAGSTTASSAHGSLAAFSPNGLYLATVVQYRLVIRDAESLQILHLFTCIDAIQAIEWSVDSTLILCASYKLGVIQVWSVAEPTDWTCKLDEGWIGLVRVAFTPDGRHIMCFSDFSVGEWEPSEKWLRITVWSLITKEAACIQFPKYPDRGYAYRGDGKYFAVAERVDGKEYLGIYNTRNWTLIERSALNTTDLAGIAWSPDGSHIAVWESYLKNSVYIYSPDGRLISHFAPITTSTGVAGGFGLGVKSVRWSPSGQILAVGGFDQRIRLLNYYTWKPITEFIHTKEVKESAINQSLTIYVELTAEDGYKQNHPFELSNNPPMSKYFAQLPPFTVPSCVPEPDKPVPKLGVGVMEFNCNGSHLVSRNDNMPTSIWVWDLLALVPVALLHQTHPVCQVAWNPVDPKILAYCCGSGSVYLWEDGHGAEALEIPSLNFNVFHIAWNPDGKSLILMDKDKFCCSFLLPSANGGDEGHYQQQSIPVISTDFDVDQ